jgi:hypothetical protein
MESGLHLAGIADEMSYGALEPAAVARASAWGDRVAEGKSLNETVKLALSEAVERRRRDPKFNARIRKIIEQDRELLEGLAK